MTQRTVVLVAGAAALAAACQMVTDFDLQPVAETSELLCADGKDNDFDGLADCQDWNCGNQLPCCDIPVVLLVDDFDAGPAECGSPGCDGNSCADPMCVPDESVWHTWPCPLTTECGGALHFNKTRINCFESGVVSLVPLTVNPGLMVEVDVLGRPERLGFVEIGLTIQTEADLGGSFDPCGTSQDVISFAAIRQVYDDAGYRAVAAFQLADVGQSEVVADVDVPHRLGIGIDGQRQVFYTLDGVQFAQGAVPVPETGDQVRLAITGVTETATVDSVRVQAGLLCHDPRDWQLAGVDAESSLVLGIDEEAGLSFDADEVFSPSVRFEGDDPELFYTGCQWLAGRNECDPLEIAIGRAVFNGDAFVRDTANPLFETGDVPAGELSGLRLNMQVDVAAGPDFRGYIAPGSGSQVFVVDSSFEEVTEVLPAGVLGEFDEQDLCCASVVDVPDGRTLMWYSGNRVRNAVNGWEIGLAVSTDGGRTFARHPTNPVLVPGPPGSFDSDGVFDPVVVYDAHRAMFRMWYEARDFFGTVRIGYAVSTDGASWSRYPGNPVIDPGALDFDSIGGPEVVLAADGRLRMWLHGRSAGEARRRIFAFENRGVSAAGPEE